MFFNILIVNPNKAFDAMRLITAEGTENNTILFIDHWSNNSDDWNIIQCQSEEARKKLLDIMENKTERIIHYTLGYKHGKNNNPYNPDTVC